mgnify:CR=1 FL=1
MVKIPPSSVHYDEKGTLYFMGGLKGAVQITQPKTANSVRTIILRKETVDLLVQEHEKHPSNPYVPLAGDGADTASDGCTRPC